MKRLVQLITICLTIAFSALIISPVGLFAQQENDNQGSLTLQQVKERLKQNEQYLKQAQQRGKAGDSAGLETALDNYDRGIEGLNTALSQGRVEGTPSQQESVYNRVQSATSKHLKVLNSLLSKVPAQAVPHIQHAIDVSQKGQQMALSHLSQLHAQQAMAQDNQSGFGRSQGMGRSEGAGRAGGFGEANAPVGGPMSGGFGHAGGPGMAGGHPGR
ncbi:MAG TPA: hypothetical protein VFC10_08350 [Terriglobia bacterium]|jgi:hypothetical protein|nr:hypothetical protein [Terriglobia bacterium]